MAAAFTPLTPHSSRAWGTAEAGKVMTAKSTSPGISERFAKQGTPEISLILRIDRVNVAGVTVLTEETEGSAAELVCPLETPINATERG